ncbi:MAG TPA: hypothetical protein VMF69_16610 [Gemmataceae bacterium]|nr:hypothetical protein [Gemmataceae bacterium]
MSANGLPPQENPVVKAGAGGNNNNMNLFLALFWLLCAVMLLAYEYYAGPLRFRLHGADHDFSWLWVLAGMLLLVLYNLKRWWWMRSYRTKQRAAAAARAGEERDRRRLSTPTAEAPDPNFHFTDEPPAPSDRGITDHPLSND